ncbi:recombinase family protein [Ruminococcus sp. NK3A76]|uniref:recombinase family protein n=1 Tax=Ruminococcus sp. NK3A76 TaxID=877411 RepID=UPI00048AB4CD|nr:recombinase family protein [Ruminococcus sp. NK3A76]
MSKKDSFTNQQKYYKKMLDNNDDYIFVGVFADEAISGTTDNRPSFQRMIRMAEQGHIDVIFTKSISRFSRKCRRPSSLL